MKRLGKILSAFICFLAVAIIVLVFVMFQVDKDGEISNMVWTDNVLSEYKAHPDDFRVEYIKVYNESYFTEDGYFAISATRYIPACNQWQMTVRYNKSSIESMAFDKKIDELPEGNLFAFRLVASDGTIYDNFKYIKEVEGRYTYYRLVFDDVSIRRVDEIHLEIYYRGDIIDGELPKKPYETLPLFYAEMPRENYNYKKELPQDNKPTANLLNSENIFD